MAKYIPDPVDEANHEMATKAVAKLLFNAVYPDADFDELTRGASREANETLHFWIDRARRVLWGV